MKLKEKLGNFELWTEDATRGLVLVAIGGSDQPHRVTVELFSAAGKNAANDATYVFNQTTLAFEKSIQVLKGGVWA